MSRRSLGATRSSDTIPLGDQDGVHELLDLGVAILGIKQDLANEVHGMLYFEGVSLFIPLYHQSDVDHLCGGCNVEQKWLPIGQGDQDQGCLTLSSAS